MTFPCHVSADERAHSGAQASLERDAYVVNEDLTTLALETIQDAEKLRAILDNESFAGPIAGLCQAMEGAAQEFAKLQRDYRLHPDQVRALTALMQAGAQMERAAFELARGE